MLSLLVSVNRYRNIWANIFAAHSCPIFIYINPVIRRKGIQQQGASKAVFGCQFSEPQIHNLAFRFIPSQWQISAKICRLFMFCRQLRLKVLVFFFTRRDNLHVAVDISILGLTHEIKPWWLFCMLVLCSSTVIRIQIGNPDLWLLDSDL
jgi:hypothetical protein